MRSTITSHSKRVLTAILLVGVTAGTAGNTLANASPAPTGGQPGAEERVSQPEARGFFDIGRPTSGPARAAQFKVVAKAAARPATKALQRSLGDSALVDIDGVTGTPRLVAKLDGYLTPASTASPKSIALGFVTDNLAGFGLAPEDLATFTFRDDYVDLNGTHHLSWQQVFGTDVVFGRGLQASVNKNGRLLTIGGAPVPSALVTPVAAATISATKAIGLARRDLGEQDLRAGARDSATRVLMFTRAKTYLGWRTVTMSANEPAISVHDATTGRLLYRRPLSSEERTERAAPQSTGVAFEYFPKAEHGGSYINVNFTKKGWLDGTATKLRGNNAHAYSDVNDNNQPSTSEEVGPKSGHSWDYKLKPFHLASISFCDNPYPCSWKPNEPFSWKTNRKQNTTQVFFFVNNFHDYLLKAPIGFTEDAGNFEMKNSSGKGLGKDGVDTQTMDGANTAGGLPDGSHIDNANMSTPPDGEAPTMQMYLQHQPGTSYPDEDPFPANNTGDEGDTVYHEYTHGLSNRLVIDPGGVSSLGGVQAGSMGEAWSDWYAFHYLVQKGLHIDQPTKVDVQLGTYDGAGQALVRTEAMDCKVGSTSAKCPGAFTGHSGGYTYADYAQIIGGPEVHADGEIWGQTLWDLRDKLGGNVSVALITRAMELAPYDPSFLDMRNAILMSDTALFGGTHQNSIWGVFAKRGMGFYAGSLGGGDAAPAADFRKPPLTITTGMITGTVTDVDSGAPVAGVPVTLAFQGGNSTVNPTAITAGDGTYSLGPVPVGDYKKLVVSGAGYETSIQTVTVIGAGTVKNFSVRRDWAAKSGGATIANFSPPDFGPFGCGPEEAIDLSLATGWGSTTGDVLGTPTNVMTPKSIVIALPQAINVTQLAVDPAATCGDGGSASLGQYTIELSVNGTTWTMASQGTFALADRGRLNPLTPTGGATGANFLRLTMLGNQTPDFANVCPLGAFSGCSFTDLSEIAVYGTPTP